MRKNEIRRRQIADGRTRTGAGRFKQAGCSSALERGLLNLAFCPPELFVTNAIMRKH